MNQNNELQLKKMKPLFEAIKYAIWHEGSFVPNQFVLEEMKKHAIVSLMASSLSHFPKELRNEWQMVIYQQLSFNVNCRYFQASLPVSVPYAILKGTSAAQYYPQPKFRALGDIDIITKREDFDIACEMLLHGGFVEIAGEIEFRHRQFQRDGFDVEVHKSFAYKNDPDTAKVFDDLILDNINTSHILPDYINGLTILEHINFHMQGGVGLRQIIDWMMFVDKCVSDDEWETFCQLARKTELDKLAKVITRMCVQYLGLPLRKWCMDIDPLLCEKLMVYILDNGNFGQKKVDYDLVSARFFSNAKTVRGTLQFLQGRGLINWKATQKYPILRPFAWIYQIGRYLKLGLKREGALKKLKQEYRDGKQRQDWFEELGATLEEKGLVYYKDGKYMKE